MAGIPGLSGWFGTVLSSRDPAALARFYSALLGWELSTESSDWLTIAIPGTTHYLAFALDEQHAPPMWPSQPGEQSMQLHLDVGVRDLEVAAGEAVALGATVAVHQPQEDVRVLLDPDGHPFCLYLDEGD